jgi:hypothetical protein
MKTTIRTSVLLSLLIISVHSFAQADSTVFKVKIDQYQRIKRAGSIVAITGAAVDAVGVGLLIAGHSAHTRGESDDDYVLSGYVALGVGLATAVTGLVFRGIGNRKITEYRIKLNDVRTGFYFTPQHSGIVLTYRF